MAGKIIVLEGVDGVGKTTQVEMLEKRLKEMGGKVFTMHFPNYGTIQAAPIERFLDKKVEGLKAIAVANLYITDFILTWHTTLKPLYDQDYIIILDRFWPSTLMYESVLADQQDGMFREDAADDIWCMIKQCGLPTRIKVIYLYADDYKKIAAQKEKLLKEEGKLPDNFEEKQDLLKEIHDFGHILSMRHEWEDIDITNMEGKVRSKEDILEDVLAAALT